MRALLVGCAVAVALATGACDPCSLGAEAGAFAGEGAEDCGFAGIGEAAREGWACAAGAFAEGRAFAFAFALQGIDSRLERAVVGRGDGRVAFFYYDDGGTFAPARVLQEDCYGPTLTPVDASLAERLRIAPGDAIIACADSGPHELVCDN